MRLGIVPTRSVSSPLLNVLPDNTSPGVAFPADHPCKIKFVPLTSLNDTSSFEVSGTNIITISFSNTLHQTIYVIVDAPVLVVLIFIATAIPSLYDVGAGLRVIV